MRMPYKTFKPLRKYMVDHDITWYDIKKNTKLSSFMVVSLQLDRIQYVRFKDIQKVMDYLGCKYTDIVGYDI